MPIESRISDDGRMLLTVVDFPNDRAIPQTLGKHTFVLTMAYVVEPPFEEDRPTAAMDNLHLAMIGCFWCEEPYRRGMENTRCPAPLEQYPTG